jgi:hypothetical protein
MSEKRYIKNCKQCGKEYVASSSKSVFDTVACRSRYHREKQDSQLKSQAKIIRTQTKIIKTVLSKKEGVNAQINKEIQALLDAKQKLGFAQRDEGALIWDKIFALTEKFID